VIYLHPPVPFKDKLRNERSTTGGFHCPLLRSLSAISAARGRERNINRTVIDRSFLSHLDKRLRIGPPFKKVRQVRSRLVMILAIATFCMGSLGQASAQSMPFGGSGSTSADRPKSTQVDFFTLMESAGDAFLGLFEDEPDSHPIDEPEWNGLESPRHTVLTFLEAMNHVAQGRTEALDRATKTFGDSGFEDTSAAATDLLHVFDRLPAISPGTIPGADMVRQQDIRRFELFPRGIDHRWAYQAIENAPNGRIVLVRNADGEWVFDESTIQGAADLLKSLESIPPRPRMQNRGKLFLSVIEPTFTKTDSSDYLYFFGFVALGILLAWGLYRSVKKLKHRRNDSGDDLIGPMLDGLLAPSMIIALAVTAAIGSTRLHLHPVLSDIRWSLIELALVVAGVFFVVAIVELICLGFRRSFFDDQDPYAQMMSLVIRRSVRIFAGIILLLFVFRNVFKWDVTAMLGGFGILALALSLAAKDAVKNLFGAATIFANRPFINGDWIEFEGKWGQVEDVSLQITRIRLLHGEMLAVPNMKFIDEPIENLSLRKYLRRVMNISITYDTSPEKVDEAMAILEEVLRSETVVGDGKGDLKLRPPKVSFEEFGEYFLKLRADYWYLMNDGQSSLQRDSERGWFSYLEHKTVVNRLVLQRFNDAEIDFAFPTQTLYLTDDPHRDLVVQTTKGNQQRLDGHSANGQSVDKQPADGQSVDGQPADRQSADKRSAERQSMV